MAILANCGGERGAELTGQFEFICGGVVLELVFVSACAIQVIAINSADPKAEAVNSLEDVER